MKKILTIIFLLFIAGTGYYFYSQSAQSTHQDIAQALPTLTVHTGSIVRNASAIGYIVPQSSIEIKSQVDGIAGEIYFQEGDLVKAGDALVKVLPNPTPQALTDAITAVKQSEANLKTATQALASLKQLVEQNIVPENYNDYVQAKANLISHKAELEQRRQSLALLQSGETSVGNSHLSSTVFAPTDGTVLNLSIEVGSSITSTTSSDTPTQLMTIANMQSLKFEGAVSEFDVAQLKEGMAASLTMAPFPDQPMSATVTKVAVQSARLNNSPMKDRFTNGFEVEAGNIQIPNNIALRSGYSAVAKIRVQDVENVVVIPERALLFADEQAQVLVVAENGTDVSRQDVTLGVSDGINVEIVQGLVAGDVIADASLMSDVSDEDNGSAAADID